MSVRWKKDVCCGQMGNLISPSIRMKLEDSAPLGASTPAFTQGQAE